MSTRFKSLNWRVITIISVNWVSSRRHPLASFLHPRTKWQHVLSTLTHTMSTSQQTIICGWDTSTQRSQKASDSSFIRSLGDVSILFTCKKVIVAPVVDPECFSMMKVQEINGVIWHLEPNTRVLMKKAVTVPCSPTSIPVYLSIQNVFLAYSPERIAISTIKPTTPNNSADNSKAGLYSKQII